MVFHRIKVVVIAGAFFLGGVIFVASGLKEPPEKKDLSRVEGTIADVMANSKRGQTRSYTIVLDGDKGVFSYDASQAGADSLNEFIEGEPVSLLVDDSYFPSPWFEIWELKRGDVVLSGYDKNLRDNTAGGGFDIAIGIGAFVIGLLILKSNFNKIY
jgi:hypothetical protein